MSNEKKWTKEPWWISSYTTKTRGIDILSKNATIIASVKLHQFTANDEKEANAKRIAACVNFLAAHPDLSKVEVVEKSEFLRLGDCEDAWFSCIDAMGGLRSQKDETGIQCAFRQIKELRASHAELFEACQALVKARRGLCSGMADATERATHLAETALTNAEAIK